MTSKRRSLAQELADLFNPAPTTEHDPDALDLGDGAKLASDDDDDGEARRAPSKRAPEKAMLLRGDISLEDVAYRGRKTSRAAIFGDDNGIGDEDDEDEDLDLGEGDDDDEEEDMSDEGEGDEGEDADGSAERRTTAGRAGPSGRGGVAAAAAGGGAGAAGQGARGRGAAKRGAAAALSNGGPHGSKGDDDEEDEEDEDDGEEDENADGELASGGDEDELEDEEDDNEGGEDEVEKEERARAPVRERAGAAEEARKRAGRAGGAAGGGGGGELEDLEAEYEALQEEDDQHLAALRKKGERNREKGVAVRNQQVLYERTLEQRILLQKCLQASNGLPRPDAHAALAEAQPEVREGYEQLATAARDTLSQLLQLQHALMARNPTITLPPAGAGAADAPSASGRGAAAKRRRSDGDDVEDDGADVSEGLDSLWLRISSHHEALAPFRDVSLDSWHRRTVLSSGSGALRNSGLRALNQSVSSQVQALMRDPAKFIKRTRLVLSACPRVLCEPSRAGAAVDAALDPLGSDGWEPAAAGQSRRGGDDGATAAAGPGSSVAADVMEEERDPETYDDSEFYQQLLKEFLDKGLSGGAAAAPRSAKKRKLVDRRASKGRKLRYHVQEKLVAFMAPVDIAPPPFAGNLFSNLFGHAGK